MRIQTSGYDSRSDDQQFCNWVNQRLEAAHAFRRDNMNAQTNPVETQATNMGSQTGWNGYLISGLVG